MSKTVVDQLRANLAQFTATERRVAHQLLADWPINVDTAAEWIKFFRVLSTSIKLAGSEAEAMLTKAIHDRVCDCGKEDHDAGRD